MFRHAKGIVIALILSTLLASMLAACGQGDTQANTPLGTEGDGSSLITPTATQVDPEEYIPEETETPTVTSVPTETPLPPVQPTLYNTPQKAHITGAANIRSRPDNNASILRTASPNTNITLYGSIEGEIAWNNISTWYLISASGKAPEYVYAGLIEKGTYTVNLSPGPSIKQGKEIVVSLSKQQLDTYENGVKVKTILVTTGKADTPTPTGNYHILQPESPSTFVSPWPKGDPNYYAPVHVTYGLPFIGRSYYLHDATWRSTFGPKFDYKHHGSHGCVTMNLSNAKWLYSWTPQGTLVRVIP